MSDEIEVTDLEVGSQEMPEEAFLAHEAVYCKTDYARSQAFSSLVRQAIEPVTLSVVKKLHLKDPQFLCHAQGKVWQELNSGKYCWQKGPFRGWCYRVVYNLAIDMIRKEMHHQNKEKQKTYYAGLRESAISEVDSQRLLRMDALHRLLRRIADVAKTPRGSVNYAAAFHLEFRRACGKYAAPHFKSGKSVQGTLAHVQAANWVINAFPWGLDGGLRIRATFPTMEQTWSEMTRLSAQGHAFEAELVVAAVRNLSVNPVDQFTPNAWHQIACRAKNDVKELTGPDVWDQTMGWLYPHRATPAKSKQRPGSGEVETCELRRELVTNQSEQSLCLLSPRSSSAGR